MVVAKRRIKTSTLLKLLNSGWQSWSLSTSHWLRLPKYNFRPRGKPSLLKSKLFKPVRLKKPAYGWCSWYIFGREINENKILAQAKWISNNNSKHRLSLDYVLIDDGWCLWGDWLHEDRTKFPGGLKKWPKRLNLYA